MQVADGTIETGTILDRIVDDKRKSLHSSKSRLPPIELHNSCIRELERPFSILQTQWRLSKAIAQGSRLLGTSQRGPKLIAEIKVASPSRGRLIQSTDGRWLEDLARTYTDGGACGISVLTEGSHFRGKLSYMDRARRSLQKRYPASRPSILRKDFLFDEYQIWEARANGADAVLLIVAILEEELLRDLMILADIKGMDALIEVHDEKEIEKALRAGAKIIGINNRDLRTFDVDLATTERLRPLIPDGKLVVAESGIYNRPDVERLATCGVHAILVGEALVTSRNVHEKMRELII